MLADFLTCLNCNFMKFVSWNVNGIRAALRKGFLDQLDLLRADILCLQETKAEQAQLSAVSWQDDYHQFWNSARKKGYSGTAVFTKIEPINVSMGLGIDEHDQEGRVINLEYEDFFLVNVYVPNSQNELRRLDYRTQKWDFAFRRHVDHLQKIKPVIFGGDLNVAHREIDLARPKDNTRHAGFTAEERKSFDKLLATGFVDSFREFEKKGGHYTWWSYRAKARARNIGWRLDYFCISKGLKNRLKQAAILPEINASDHCPVSIVLD